MSEEKRLSSMMQEANTTSQIALIPKMKNCEKGSSLEATLVRYFITS